MRETQSSKLSRNFGDRSTLAECEKFNNNSESVEVFRKFFGSQIISVVELLTFK